MAVLRTLHEATTGDAVRVRLVSRGDLFALVFEEDRLAGVLFLRQLDGKPLNRREAIAKFIEQVGRADAA